MAKLISTNPANNYEVVGEIEISTDKDISEKVYCANQTKTIWKEMGIKKRIELLNPIYQDFQDKADEIAMLATKETGRSITESKAIISGHIKKIKWFLDNAESALSDEITYEDNESIHKIVYEPIGTAAVITPWNHPFGMFVWGGNSKSSRWEHSRF